MSFTWINAGMDYHSFGGMDLYVRYKDRKGKYEEKAYPNGYLIKLMDRELFMTKAGYKLLDLKLPMGSFDQAVSMDIIGGNSAVSHNGIMFTYTEKKSKHAIHYDKLAIENTIYGDSGGFALLSGAKDFINPVDVADWYSHYVNKGMALDVPLAVGSPSDYLEKTAMIQVKNNEIMLDRCENVELYNVCHGFTVDQKRRYIDIVDNDRMKSWALGSIYYGNVFDLIHGIFSVLTYKEAKSYHVFGVANTKILPILAWIGKYYNITSDSSTPLQSGRSTVYFTALDHALKKLRVGRTDNKLLFSKNNFPLLPCSCNICNALRTSELFVKSNLSCVFHIVCILHNINVMAKYTDIWNNLAKESTLSEYKKILDKTYQRHSLFWKRAVDYIEYIKSTSLEKGYDKYISYFTMFSTQSTPTSDGFSLFSDQEVNFSKEHTSKVIDNFISYYGGDILIKNKIKKNKCNYKNEKIGISTNSKKRKKKSKKKERKNAKTK